MNAALALLRDRAPDDYRVVERYIGQITEVEQWYQSGMRAYAYPPTAYISLGTVRYSPTWCAGAIVHEACHSRLWHDYRIRHRVEWVPEKEWSGQKVELACITYQIEVMKRLGAPERELDSLKRQDGRHYLEATRLREREARGGRDHRVR